MSKHKPEFYFSPTSGGFFHRSIHFDIPGDAVEVSEARHRELMEAQAEGKEIYVGEDGNPRFRQLHVPAAARRAATARRVRAEARRRIEEISPIWQQLNDLRDSMTPEAGDRFDRIDAVRAASNQIETRLAGIPADELQVLDIKALAEWPSEES